MLAEIRISGSLQDVSFNLITQDWIYCSDSEGTIKKYSLQNVFRYASSISKLSGDSATQNAALFRVLLAILRRSLNGPSSTNRWEELWKQENLPMDIIESYLDNWKQRFDLFGKTPFFQVKDLSVNKGFSPSSKIVPTIPTGNNTPLFVPRTDANPPCLKLDEAARWLIHAQAWDTAGLKTGAIGDPKVTGGTTKGNKTGLLGGLGVVIPLGKTLKESLLLNLIPRDQQKIVKDNLMDLPVWEKEPLGSIWQERIPTGQCDLFTWASRRIKLIPKLDSKEVCIKEVIVTAGDRIAGILPIDMEIHTAWKRSPNQESKQKTYPVYTPVTHDPSKQIWRGLGALLARNKPDEVTFKGKEAPLFVAPLVLEWLGTLEDNDVTEISSLRIEAIGLTYGTQSAIIEDSYFDQLPLPALLLKKQEGSYVIVQKAQDAIQTAEEVSKIIRDLIGNLYRASGGKEDSQRKSLANAYISSFYYELDFLYRQLLVDLSKPNAELVSLEINWQISVKEIAEKIADLAIRSTPQAAFEIRETDGRDYSIPAAEVFFRRGLHKALQLLN